MKKPSYIFIVLVAIAPVLVGSFFGLQKIKRERVLSAWKMEAQSEVAQNEAERVAADQAKRTNDEIQKTNDEMQKANAEVQGRRQKEASAKTQEKNKNGELERFFSGFDVTLADKTVPFSDSKSGISFILPYRETWDIDPDHPLDPYDIESGGLVPRTAPYSSSFPWLFGFSAKPKGTFSFSGGKLVLPPLYTDMNNPTVSEINGFKVIKGITSDYGLCGDSPIMVVLGRKFDYFFTADCPRDEKYFENIYSYLESIIRTIQLAAGF